MGFLDCLFEPSTEYSSDFFRWDRKDTLYRGEYYKEGSALYAHGKGHMIFADGGEYEGNFERSKYHGYGVKTYKNGDVYKGYWKNNKKNGEGVWTCANGYIFSGEFIDNYLPYGKVVYPSGDYYIGELNEKYQRHGNGTYYSRTFGPKCGRWNHGDMTN